MTARFEDQVGRVVMTDGLVQSYGSRSFERTTLSVLKHVGPLLALLVACACSGFESEKGFGIGGSRSQLHLVGSYNLREVNAHAHHGEELSWFVNVHKLSLNRDKGLPFNRIRAGARAQRHQGQKRDPIRSLGSKELLYTEDLFLREKFMQDTHRSHCGGAHIAPGKVITAAHCLLYAYGPDDILFYDTDRFRILFYLQGQSFAVPVVARYFLGQGSDLAILTFDYDQWVTTLPEGVVGPKTLPLATAVDYSGEVRVYGTGSMLAAERSYQHLMSPYDHESSPPGSRRGGDHGLDRIVSSQLYPYKAYRQKHPQADLRAEMYQPGVNESLMAFRVEAWMVVGLERNKQAICTGDSGSPITQIDAHGVESWVGLNSMGHGFWQDQTKRHWIQKLGLLEATGCGGDVVSPTVDNFARLIVESLAL